MRRIQVLPLLIALPLAAACGDSPDVAFEGFEDEAEVSAREADDRIAIHTRNGEVKLGLTDAVVYMRLSDDQLAEVRRDIEDDVADRDGLGRTIAEAVTSGVDRLLRHRVELPVDDIRDIRHQDGRLVFEFEEGVDGWNIDGDDEEPGPFDEDEARRFIREFREVKEARTR